MGEERPRSCRTSPLQTTSLTYGAAPAGKMSTRWTSRARFHLLRSAGYREGNSAERSSRPNPSGPHGGHPTLLDREGPGNTLFPLGFDRATVFGADVAAAARKRPFPVPPSVLPLAFGSRGFPRTMRECDRPVLA